MRRNAKSVDFIDAITSGIDLNEQPAKPLNEDRDLNDDDGDGVKKSRDGHANKESDNSPNTPFLDREPIGSLLPALDPRALVGAALLKGVPLSELIIEKRNEQEEQKLKPELPAGKRKKSRRTKKKVGVDSSLQQNGISEL